MHTNMRGELTNQHQNDHQFELTNSDMVEAVANYLKSSNKEEICEMKSCISPILVNSLASTGNLDLLKKLHMEGANLNEIDYLGRGVIHVIANYKGGVEIMKYLV